MGKRKEGRKEEEGKGGKEREGREERRDGFNLAQGPTCDKAGSVLKCYGNYLPFLFNRLIFSGVTPGPSKMNFEKLLEQNSYSQHVPDVEPTESKH